MKRGFLLTIIFRLALSLAAIGFFVVLSSPVMAGGVAPQLKNKSIVLTWGQSNVWRRISDNTTGTTAQTVERTIYISSAGRPFVRQKRSAARTLSIKADSGPESETGRFTFDGNNVVNFISNGSWATRIAMTFDPSFSSCSVAITTGKNGQNPRSTGMDGGIYEASALDISSASCSMKDGNALTGG